MEQNSAIMPIAFRQLSPLILPVLVFGGGLAIAQEGSSDPTLKLIRGGGTPAVFGGRNQPLPASTCPAIVNVAAGEIQPLRISPADVAAKNRMGCVSPNDAFYGADGCPLRLCGAMQGTVPLPSGTGPNQARPELPEP